MPARVLNSRLRGFVPDDYMSEQEKAALEATAEETQEVSEAQDEETTQGEGQPEADEVSKQLEAALQREKDALEAKKKAEAALAEKAFKFRAKKREVPEEQAEEHQAEDEKPLTRSELLGLLAEEREERQKQSLESEARRLASSIATTEQEAEGVFMAWQNRKFPSNLSLGEQLEESYLAINRKKILGENTELKRALLGKSNVSRDASTTHHDSPTGTAPGVDAEMAQLGYKFNSRTKRLEKKLPDGRTLVIDPKTNKTSIAA